ncbi:hypothetical protein K491DRAFT_697913 [Lophiostoma macrostomum CBS 122681]|uniref:Uncharacterized protein n=1 Tax=Lophiostoma macrostomum CBS 122681 TaxID=1314788 RepID=A0A6A6SSX5_9PLEO|nr:hypothetical protein K491DRAFT_697913 [Lophiostoma macrostomum CBS 122681]
MAVLSSPTISPVLKEVAELKMEELNREKEAFRNRYHGNPAILAAGNNTQKRVAALLGEIKKLDPVLEDDDDLSTLTRYIEQAEHDSSISEAKLLRWEKKLLNKPMLRAHQLDVSSFHVELLREYIHANDSPNQLSARQEGAILDDDFELVESELEAVFEKFERNTFMSPSVETKQLEGYITSLFEDDESKAAISRLREDIEEAADDALDGTVEVDEEAIEWCIRDLLTKDTLGEEERRSLRSYLDSPQAIRELKGILNMKLVRHWNWKEAKGGLPVIARQDSDGKYCMTVVETVIDALYLHTVAIGWSIRLRKYLTDLVKKPAVWMRNTLPSREDMHKRDFYILAKSGRKPRAPPAAVCTICHGPPLAGPPLPPPGIIDMSPPPPPMALWEPPPPPPVYHAPYRSSNKKTRREFISAGPSFGANLNEERFRDYMTNFFLSRLPKCYNPRPEVSPALDTQANLITFLVTELRLREGLHDGDVRLLKASVVDFASGLPHQTALVLLKFIGVPELWLEFFERFLQAPLNMGPLIRGTSDQILQRTNGVPDGHGMEVFLEELIMFFLDFAVHKKTGGYLYRLGGECYFVGSDEQCKETKAQIISFAHAMCLSMTITEPAGEGSVSIGHLNLGFDETVKIEINNDLVDSQARRVAKQLSKRSTVLEWVRTWNHTMGSYAAHLFGPLASVMGTSHLQAVQAAYTRMFDIIFGSSNLTDHVKRLLLTHFPHSLRDPPFHLEPLIYLPSAYGGLGVKNPFITLNLARDVSEDPTAIVREFLDEEKAHYKKAKAHFDGFTAEVRARKISNLFEDKQDRIDAALGPGRDLTAFMTFEEFTKHREAIPYPYVPLPLPPAPMTSYTPIPSLVQTYKSLLEEPVDHVNGSERVMQSTRSLAGKNGMKKWFSLSGEERWVLQMYEDECFERYGGMEIWYGEAVPLELLRVVRGEDMGEEDNDDDDEGSDSDVTEV